MDYSVEGWRSTVWNMLEDGGNPKQKSLYHFISAFSDVTGPESRLQLDMWAESSTTPSLYIVVSLERLIMTGLRCGFLQLHFSNRKVRNAVALSKPVHNWDIMIRFCSYFFALISRRLRKHAVGLEANIYLNCDSKDVRRITIKTFRIKKIQFHEV